MDSTADGKHTSIWLDTSPSTDYVALNRNRNRRYGCRGWWNCWSDDGIRTSADQTVPLLERYKIAEGVTGYTTAKFTSLLGVIFAYLIDEIDEE